MIPADADGGVGRRRAVFAPASDAAMLKAKPQEALIRGLGGKSESLPTARGDLHDLDALGARGPFQGSIRRG